MIKEVDLYLQEGCGRCSHFRTPSCKVHTWQAELRELRRIVLECGLDEMYKWSQPCYGLENRNYLIVTAFKEFASISFFKGTLLKDEQNLLHSPGKSSQSAKYLKFMSFTEIQNMEPVIKAYIQETIKLEKQGVKVEFKKNPEPIPAELDEQLKANSSFQHAWEALTPGRQRGYILYISQPISAASRLSRIEKCKPKIMNGEGLHDKYKTMKK